MNGLHLQEKSFKTYYNQAVIQLSAMWLLGNFLMSLDVYFFTFKMMFYRDILDIKINENEKKWEIWQKKMELILKITSEPRHL